jgi:membrane fusion protein (multidrug efflux system)
MDGVTNQRSDPAKAGGPAPEQIGMVVQKPPAHRLRKGLLGGGAAIVLAVVGYFLVPIVATMLNTVSTDDAYVNGHVTFVAPRVAGQVSSVLVDDNMRVKKGALLVQIDKEPYQIQVAIKKAFVAAAETDLVAAKSQVRGLEALARSQRWQTEAAVEQVDNQVALIKAKVAAYASMQATQKRARANLERARRVSDSNAISREDFDQRRQAAQVADAQVKQSLEEIHQVRAGLGLPPESPDGDLTTVPPGLNQTYSGVRTSLAKMIQTMPRSACPFRVPTPPPSRSWMSSESATPAGTSTASSRDSC